MGKGGKPKELMKYSVLHVKSYCRQRRGVVGRGRESRLRGEETERGDTLQVGTAGRLNVALIQDSTKVQRKSQEGVCVGERQGGKGTKPDDPYLIISLDKVCNQVPRSANRATQIISHAVEVAASTSWTVFWGVNDLGLGGVGMQKCPTSNRAGVRVEAHCTFSFLQEVNQNNI